MTKLKLSVGERLAINNLLNDFKGGLSDLNKVFKIMDKVGFKEEETKYFELISTVSRGGAPQMSWDIKKDKEVEIEFSEEQVKTIKEELTKKSESKELTIGDKFLVGLAGKVGLDLEEKEEK